MSTKLLVNYDYDATTSNEISIRVNDVVTLLNAEGDWWLVENSNNNKGYVPSNYVTEIKGVNQSNQGPTLGYSSSGLSGIDFSGTSTNYSTGDNSNVNLSGIQASRNGPTNPASTATTTATSSASLICKAIHDYAPTRQDELLLNVGDEITILSKSDDGWWMGRSNGKDGWFPSNFVKLIDDSNGGSGTDTNVPAVLSPVTNPIQQTPSNSYENDILHHVKTLYKFDGEANELNFNPDEVLHIIEKPPDSLEWWRARNPITGLSGLIPTNFVRVLGPDEIPQSNQKNKLHDLQIKSLHEKPYFKPGLTRATAEGLLRNSVIGKFLVRNSETNPGSDKYSISVKGNNGFRHFVVHFEDQAWRIGAVKKFQNFDLLIDHYTRYPIFMDNTEQLHLTEYLN